MCVGVEVKFRNAFYEVLIFPSYISELNILEVTNRGLTVGGTVTLTDLSSKLKELVNTLPSNAVQFTKLLLVCSDCYCMVNCDVSSSY